MLALALITAAFLVPAPLAPAVRSLPAAVRLGTPIMEESEWDKYLATRDSAEMAAVEADYKSFKGIDQEFDGGDSGGGVVGDGNTDLEDQHNSATLGANRGGIADLGAGGVSVGRGNVRTLDEPVKGATEARVSSAGANYFGRSKGIAEKLIEDITEDQVKNKRMDKVRAQQKENWFNQRAIHAANREAGQGVVFGESSEGRPREGGYIARESIASDAWRSGARESEISQRDLAKHMDVISSLPAERLDGQEWGELVITSADTVQETFEVRASPRQTHVTTINVINDFNTFAPFRCGFIGGSSSAFTVNPPHGSMNRRSGAPIEVVVRYTPQGTGEVLEATLVFETEDMKKIYKFIGST
uniref:MSP domain-containing protein n=1 Tax=Haptolina brevifila TaxID=156173 RepID=A0A7S2DWS5_9EUKA